MGNKEVGLSPELEEWLIDFKKNHGKPPRVLHIGNIANNAYNNAKLLNQMGITSDVICYDYYHIMGCPEWEDADFEGVLKNEFFPNWKSVKLNGFKRPKWFAQGPLRICIKYLKAKNRNQKLISGILWILLELNRNLIVNKLFNLSRRLKRIFISIRLYQFVKGTAPFSRMVYYFLQVFYSVVMFGYYLLLNIATILFLPCLSNKFILKSPPKKDNTHGSNNFFEKRVDQLVSLFEETFPERIDKLTNSDVLQYQKIMDEWKELFKFYDICEAYSTDPILTLIANNIPYVAYEHGTIRDIPFENNPVAKLTSLAYSNARHVFITNPDCHRRVNDLKIKSFSFVPHVIDGKYKPSFSTVRKTYRINNDCFMVFAPARQNWEVKGNDITIKAFSEFIKYHHNSVLVIPFWGQDVEKSRVLIRNLKIEDQIISIPTLNIKKLIDWLNACDCVIDQYLGFGGIAPSALACGKPLIMNFDISLHQWAFKEMPPIFWANTVESVYKQLIAIYNLNLDDYQLKATEWVKQNYGFNMVINEHLNVYKNILSKQKLKSQN